MNIVKRLFFIGILIVAISCSKNSDSEDGSGSAGMNKAANKLTTGDSANDFLSNDIYDKILIEIAYVKGFRPTSEAISHFRDFLEFYTFKENIEIIYNELPSPTEDELTLNEISNLETKNRTAYNSGSTLAIYIYFADAPAEGDDLDGGLVTLGAVYRNTSMVIHEKTIRNLASKSISISTTDVETTTLNHEFGHLFGLVNLGTAMVNNHESQSENDEGELEGNNHCNVAGCLMRAELQFGGATGKSLRSSSKAIYEDGVTSVCTLSGATVLRLLNQKTARTTLGLDAQCMLDIRANGGR